MAFEVVKSKKTAIVPSIALIGASGSGKTYSALRLAKGLASGGKIVIIDTENKRSAYYSDDFDFNAIYLSAPFTPARYMSASRAAIEQGAKVLIIDQITYEWAGTGGVLQMVDENPSSNAFAKWKEPSKNHNEFLDFLVNCKIPNIVCIRAKEKYEIQEDEKGKKVPVKIGLGPIQREGIEYEFPIAFLLRSDHSATATKDNTKLFKERVDFLDEEVGKNILAWSKKEKAKK